MPKTLSIRGMKSAAAFIELPVMAEVRAVGSAQDVVAVNWRMKRAAWSRKWEYEPEGWREPTALTGLRALLDTACMQPRLRHLYAVTSHYVLWFSSCTDYPYARVGAAIEPLSDGRYRVGFTATRASTSTQRRPPSLAPPISCPLIAVPPSSARSPMLPTELKPAHF